MESQMRKEAGTNTQITFKTSPEENLRIKEKAANFDMSVSEYCRTKLLSENDATVQALSRVAELEKEIRRLRVELDNYQNAVCNPNDIVLKLTPQQKEVLEAIMRSLYSSYFETETSLGQAIRELLFQFIKRDSENLRKEYWDKVGISWDEMLDAFYPDDNESEY